MAENVTDLAPGSYGFAASVRHSDGHLIIASMSAYDSSTTHSVWDVNGTGSITALTSIQSATDDHYYPAVFIDQTTNAIYVAYNGKRDGSETLATTTKVYYTKSTDAGTSWSAGDTAYMEGAAGVVVQIWAPLSGPRLYVGWRVGTTLLGNKVNSVLVQTLAGSATATFSPTAAMVATGDLAGSGIASFAPVAAMGGTGDLTGSSTISFALTAAMDAVVNAAGALTVEFAPVATLEGAGALVGSGTLAFEPVAALEGAGA
jgi:phosphoribosyl-AMP cyclohydrolase